MTTKGITSSQADRVTTGTLLSALAYASDLAFGLQLEDSLRSCYVAFRIAQRLGLPEDECTATYYMALMKDAGCTSWTTELADAWQADEITARRELVIFGNPKSIRAFGAWMKQYVATDKPGLSRLTRYFRVLTSSRGMFVEAFATTASTSRRIATRLGMPDSIQSAALHMFEQWNGEGAPHGMQGTDIPLISRIVLPTFFIVPMHRVAGRDAAVRLAANQRGQAFDPDVVDAFSALAADESFWLGLESEDILQAVLAMEPDSPMRTVSEERIDDVALAFADFIDLKSRFMAAHSRRVAAIAEQVAVLLGSAPSAVTQIRRAALLHDLGIVGVPSYILERPWRELSESERDQYRLHPFHGERILQRIAFFNPLAEMVGTHQERMDGTGYYRGLSGQGLSLGARIIGVADRLDELTHAEPGRKALPIPDALGQLGREPFDQQIVAAVSRCLGQRLLGDVATASLPPSNLTERETQVLRLAARGLTRRDIAFTLGITENTVRHHLEHIYDKTSSTNRVTLTLYAMENGLLLD